MSQLAIIPVVLLMTQSKWFFQERISSIKTPKCLMYLLCSKLTLFFTQIFLFVEDNVLLFWKGFLTREKDRKQNEEMMCVIWKKISSLTKAIGLYLFLNTSSVFSALSLILLLASLYIL